MARTSRWMDSNSGSLAQRASDTTDWKVRLTHRSFYAQKLLPTEAFTHRLLYTQTLLHTDAFTYRPFYTQTLLHTEAFTHRSFYTQTLLHNRPFYTQTLLHTEAFTHKTLSHTETGPVKSQFYLVLHFLTFNIHFVRKGCDGPSKIAISPQFLTFNVHFVRKGCDGLS